MKPSAYFLMGVVVTLCLLGASRLIGIPHMIGNADAQSDVFCDPIYRPDHDSFAALTTKIGGLPNTEIIASNAMITPDGRVAFYALVCSK